jgi:hypothetical protein
LDTNQTPTTFAKRRARRLTIIGASLAVLCVVFTFIYEKFSFGVYSPFMRLMFLCPLVGCALPGLIGWLLPTGLGVCRAAFNLWNSGVAAVCFGLLHRGIVNVSGRQTSDDRIFYILGGLLLAAAVCTEIAVAIFRRVQRNKMKENVEND